jgi:UTP:GlnB (protein PII) uridylyltransferase
MLSVNMSSDTTSRTYALIEELRADIDFELEDVVTEIVRELPEDYFQRINHADQLVHLKALLALSFCKLQEELMFRSSDGIHIAVIARQNYSGQLADILNRLPDDQNLIGAKIFTSQSQNFIIDLFEFETPAETENAQLDPDQSAQAELKLTDATQALLERLEADVETIAEFLSHYSPNNQILTQTTSLCEHFLAYQQSRAEKKPAVRVVETSTENLIRLTTASQRIDARSLVHRIADYLGKESINIERAYLNDLLFKDSANVAIASFILASESVDSFASHSAAISKLLDKCLGTCSE